MFYLESHQQWKELMDREMRGESIEAQLEPGYKQSYEAWKMEQKELLPKLSASDRVDYFAKVIQKEVLTQKKQIIETMNVSEDEKKRLLALAQKDQLLLVSTDEGAHFDQVLTLEQAQKMDPLKLRILSQTLTSASIDLEKVIEEQTLLHVVAKFTSAGYEVHEAELENHQVKVEVTEPKKTVSEMEVSSSTTYRVPIVQNDLLPLEIFGSEEQKEVHFSETVLPEQVGEPTQDSNMGLSPEDAVKTLAVQTAFDSQKNTKEAKVKAALATYSAIAGMQIANEQAELDRKTALLQAYESERDPSADKAQEQFEIHTRANHVPMLDVMGAKQKLQAQKEKENKDEEGQEIRKKSRDEKYEKDRQRSLAKQADQLAYQAESKKTAGNKLKWGAAIGGASAAGFTAGLAGLGIWVG